MQLLYKNKWANASMAADAKKAVIKVEGYIGIPRSWYMDEAMRADIVATKEEMAHEIKTIINLKVAEVDVEINSYGGDVNHGIAMYEALVQCGAKVNVRIHGFTASIATVIAMAAKIENRTASINSQGLVHESRTGDYGVAATLRATADWLVKINNQIAEIYVKSTTMAKEAVVELMSRNNGEGEWLTAMEMKEYGLISDTFEPMTAAASFENEINACGWLPQLPTSVVEPLPSDSVIDKLVNEFNDKFVQPLMNLLPKNTLKPENDMSKQTIVLAALCAALGFESIEATNEGVYLSGDDLTKLDNHLAKSMADTATALASATTATTELSTTLEAINGIDKTVADAPTAAEKVTAIKAKLAAKPGAAPTGHTGGDGSNPSTDGVDWDAINNLSHNKAADNTIL